MEGLLLLANRYGAYNYSFQHRQLLLSSSYAFLPLPSFRHLSVCIHNKQSGLSFTCPERPLLLTLAILQANIVPVLVTNHTVTIAVELVCSLEILTSLGS